MKKMKMTVQKTAKHFSISESSLNHWRREKGNEHWSNNHGTKGPNFEKTGFHILYDPKDVRDFITAVILSPELQAIYRAITRNWVNGLSIFAEIAKKAQKGKTK